MTLRSLFAAGEYFRVPAFQRSYAWDETEALELLNDLRDGLSIGIAHFIGTIVLVRDEETGSHEIVDGQQRLTTMTIIIAILRDLLTKDATIRDDLRAALADESSRHATRWRLTLNEFDAAFFRASVQESGATLLGLKDHEGGESRDRLINNTAKLLGAIREIPKKELAELGSYVLDGVSLVIVHVADREAAQRVFRVLNDRGKGASNHDIIKTELFEKAGLNPTEVNEHARKWSEYEARIRGRGMDELLQQIRIIIERANGKGGSFLTGFKKTTIGRIDPRTFLTDELPIYVEACETLNSLQIPGLKDSDGRISASLRHLSTIDHIIWRPAAIRFLVERRDDEVGARQFFTLLERLAFVMQLVVTDRKQRDKRYRRVLEAIDDDRVLFDGEGPLAIPRDEADKIAERLLGKFTAIGPRRNLMLRVNAAMPDGQVISAKSDVSVEHVLPKSPDAESYWMTVWPNADLRSQLCETLGNFVLLPRAVNQKADRLDFRSKKEIYFEDGEGDEYAVTRELREIDTWTPDVVRKRTERLAGYLMAAWGLDWRK